MVRGKKWRRPKKAGPDRGVSLRGIGEWLRSGATVRVVVISLAAVLAVGVLLGTLATGKLTPGAKTAAIVDQLSLTFPNPDFVQEATDTLEQAGFEVDYYRGEEVTVEFYRDLPSHGYELIILRVHSAVPMKDLGVQADVPQDIVERVLAAVGDNALLFTSEPYEREKYLEEQKGLRLFPVRYSGDDPGDLHFAIASDFVRSSMKGEFDQSTVMLMGCSGLTFDSTAAAFAERGAGVVVGWDGPVSADHTDATTERLLRHLLVDGLTTRDAVAQTAAEVGRDPVYGSTLQVRPAKG